jgi:hypothetical protein
VLNHPDFWRSPREGLGVFAAPGALHSYWMPMAVEETLVVGDRFHVKPLLKLLAANRRYLVLTVSAKQARLYEGTAFSLDEIASKDFPVLRDDLLESKGRSYTESAVRGNSSPVFHGHGHPSEFKKDEATRFFRLVDERLLATFHDDQLPLVLAGSVPYLPLYREVSGYPSLVAESVEGNFDQGHPDDLHARTWPVMAGHLAGFESEVLAEHDKAVSRGQASAELSTLGKAAVQGRIRRLLLADGSHVWGSLDGETGEVTVHDQNQVGDDDVLDDLAELTLRRGGEVLLLDRERLPARAAAAALMRW